MNRSEYMNSLVDQGLSKQEILNKLAEYDAGKSQDPATVEANVGSNNTASSSESGSSESQENNNLSVFENQNKNYLQRREDYINAEGEFDTPEMKAIPLATRAKNVDKFVTAPDVSEYERGVSLDQDGKSRKQKTSFYNEFEDKLNKHLDANFNVTRDKDGNINDIRHKTDTEEYDRARGEGMFGIKDMQTRYVASSDEEIGRAINDVIKNEFIAKDPVLKRKTEEYNKKIQPKIEAIREELIQKYQGRLTSDAKFNEDIYDQMNKEFEDRRRLLGEDLYDDPEFQARIQKYEKIRNNYFDSSIKKIKRFRDPSLRLYDNIPYVGNLLEGMDSAVAGMIQGGKGVVLNKEEKDITSAQKELTELKNKLAKNPELGDQEKEYITGTVELFGKDDKGEQRTRVKKEKGTLNDLIKKKEDELAEHTKNYLSVLESYEKGKDKQALYRSFSITDGDVDLGDVLGTIGNVAPYMAVAVTPYVGAPLIAATSYGNSRQDILANQMSKKLGKDVSELTAQDYVDFAKNNEEEINEFYVGAGAVAMAYLERLGATKVASKTAKVLGLGKSANSQVYGSLLKGHFGKFAQGLSGRAKDATLSSVFEGGTEVLQETIEGVGNYLGDETINDKSFNNAFLNNEYVRADELLEAGAAGALIGGIFPGLGGIAKQTTVELRTAARMFSTKFDMKNNSARAEQYFDGLKQELERRKGLSPGNPLRLTEAEYKQEIDYMQDLYGKSMRVKGNLDANVKHDIFKLMYERDNVKKELADPNVDESAHKKLNSRLVEINAEIENKQGVDFVKSGIKQLKDLGFTEDLDIDAGKSQAELEKEFEGNEDAVKTSYGWFDPKTNKMFVNSELANMDGNVTTAQHEFLHPITKALIQSGKIKKETILDLVNKYDTNNYVQGRIDGDKETYTDEYMDKNLDEYLAMFGEGVAANEINIENESTFTGVKNFVKQVLGVALPKANIDFNTVDGLKNFMVEYSKSDREGKLTESLVSSLKGVKQVGREGEAVMSSRLADKLSEYGGNKTRLVNETLMSTPDGRMVDMQSVPLTESEFGQEIGGVVESITKRLFDKIPSDLTRVLNEDRGKARQAYKDALVSKAATILQNEWDPSKQRGQSLDSWLTQLLNQRANSLATELGVEQTFTQEATGQEATTEIETTQEADKEFINIREGVFRIETGSPQYEKILNKVKDIITRKNLVKRSGKKVVLDFNNKNLRKDLNEIFQKEVRKILVSEGLIPKNVDDYKAWLGKNKGRIWSKLSQDVINKRFPDLVTKVVDRQTRKQSKLDINTKNINAGNALFIKNNIDTDAFVEYFSGRARKESLGQALAIELANDATVQVMGDPDVLLKRDQEGLNKGTMKNESAKAAMAKVVQRPTDLVFSKKAAELSVGDGPQKSDYDKIIDTFKSKDFIDDLDKYASDPSGKVRSSIKRIINEHLRKAGLETVSIGDISKIADQMIPGAIKVDVQGNLDIENAGQTIANYLLSTHEGSREVISVKAGVEGGFDKSDLKVINNGRKAVKSSTEAILDGEIYDGDKKVKLKTDPKNLKLINRAYVNPGDMGGFKSKNGTTPADIKVKETEVQKKDGQKRTSLFLNESDFSNNVSSLQDQNSLTSKLGSKDAYINDKNVDINPNDYKEIRDDSIKAKKILQDYIDDLRLLVKHGYISNKQARILIESQFQDTNGLGRQAAVLSYIPTKGIDAIRKLLNIDGDNFVFEHMIPANNIATLAYNYIINGDAKSKKDFDAEFKNYKSAIIPKAIDNVLKDKGTMSIMGIKHKLGQDPLTSRYENILDNIEVHDLENGNIIGENKVVLSKSYKKDQLIDKAIEMARRTDAPKKGITVMDFDDTVAKTKSKIGVTMPDGKFKKINATEFAKASSELSEQGAIFDFSEFNEVKSGQKGPLFDIIKKRVEKFGNKDVFILTARPQESAGAIKKFLEDNGVDIPIENITGLENGSPEAKADFMIAKAAEGYNDFYFADDAIKNVKAVKDVLDIVDVKSDIQQAREDIVFSKRGKKSQKFNEILEETKGIRAETEYSDAAGKARGARKGKFSFFIPPSAEDLMGLMYRFMGKGKQGEAHKKFFEDMIAKPLARGIDSINRAKQALRNDYEAIKKEYKDVHNKLKIDSGYNNFTNDVAVRVYLWTKAGMKIPGLSKTDIKNLTDIVKNDPRMLEFANKVSAATKLKEGYIEPQDDWLASSIGLDILNINQTIRRGEYLKEFNDNVAEIFSPENKNKIRALYGDNFVEALEDVIYRVQNGTNRNFGKNRLVNNFMTWINSATGTIMFFNTRSAVLQTISFANFVNFTDNNILAAGRAFANQGQFWKDFGTLFDSDFLKQRRGGMSQDVNWQEITDAIKGSKSPVTRAISLLLQKGFLPTQIADSFAIALGGASFFRNRIGKYEKEGMSPGDAEKQAFLDFQEVAEKTQQSGRPDLISQQQASPLGRVLLAFQNVTMQYNRLAKKDVLDLVNGRREPGVDSYTKSAAIKVGRVAYYMGMQNLIFNAMQQALFAMIFDDETDEEEKERYNGIANGMADSILRGMGIAGGIVATLKNMAIRFAREDAKPGGRGDYAYVLIEGINVSPPVGSKARKVYSALKTYEFNKEEMKRKGLSLDNPAYEAAANVISAGTNVPTDRLYYKIESIGTMLDNETQAWQRIALALGWRDWQLGLTDAKPKPPMVYDRKRQSRDSGARKTISRKSN